MVTFSPASLADLSAALCSTRRPFYRIEGASRFHVKQFATSKLSGQAEKFAVGKPGMEDGLEVRGRVDFAEPGTF